MTHDEYRSQELSRHLKSMEGRRLLQRDWKSDADGWIDPQDSVKRISWLLNGTYGAGPMFHAEQIIKNNKPLAAGRELVILITLLDTHSINARKLTQLWKAAGVDFDAINTAAAAEIKTFQEQTE
jgi:hypothetical protein